MTNHQNPLHIDTSSCILFTVEHDNVFSPPPTARRAGRKDTMKQTTTTRAMINAAINALCAGANDRIKFAPVEKGYQFDRVIIAVYHKGARRPFNAALVMVDTFRGIVHTADMIVIAPECMDAYRDIKAVKITAADVAEFVEPAAEQEQEAPTETEQATEKATPATDAAQKPTAATETAAPLQLETLAARLDRMTAAELVNLYAATSAPGSIDDETDSAIYYALRAVNPHAYRVWMKYSIEYTPGDPASIEAANAADVERLRAAYGVTA